MEENIKLSEEKYEELCERACSNFEPSGDKEKDEEKLLFRICQLVFRYLNEPLDFIQAGETNLYKYKYNLQQLVLNKQSEAFNPLQIPGKFILNTLDKAYKQTE